MKKIGLLLLLLGCSTMALAAVAPEEDRVFTPIEIVDASSKKIEVEVPEEVDYRKELQDEDFANARQLRGAEESRRARNLIEQIQNNPDDVMRQAFGFGSENIDMSHYENKKALGTTREVEGVKMKENIPANTHWAESMADVQLPEFAGDYNDLRELQEDYEKIKKEGYENMKNADFQQLRRSVPVVRVQ